jgi:uncharacterized protein (DUF1810 family)
MSRLDRFKDAQNDSQAGFASALGEVRRGRKVGHWIWYVFPQISGLGSSGPSMRFAIDDEDEAAEFLRDAELRGRLLTISDAVAEQLKAGKPSSLAALMGSDIDARKVVSSLTLFGHVAQKLADTEGADVYRPMVIVANEVLSLAASQGYPPCGYTLRCLRAPR